MLSAVNASGIPFCTIFGNHDDAPLETRKLKNYQLESVPFSTDDDSKGSKFTRLELARYEMERYNSKSYTKIGPTNIHGVSNYYLLVYSSNAVTSAGDECLHCM